MRTRGLAFAVALCAFVSGAAQAFDAAPDAKPSPAPGEAGARTARSLECSQKADAKDLHGKARKRFMHDCKHGD